jgi:hypothetical protein
MSEIILDILRRKVDPARVKHVSGTKGGEWHSPCPVCGGNDRFHVWPNQGGGDTAQRAGVSGTWWCRACDRGGDVIELLMFSEGLEFRAACKELRIELSESGRRFRPLRQPQRDASGWAPADWKVPQEKWREQATKLALFAHEQLLSHEKALAWLAGRGLPLEAVKRYRLGHLKGEDKTGACLYRARSAFGLADKKNADGTKTRSVLWIPRSFTIPLWRGDEAHRVRLRRYAADLKSPKDSKYLMIEGSGQAPMTLPPEGVAPELAVWVVVEAELDAMAVHHACGGKVGVMASLTNLGKPDAEAHRMLSRAKRILVALDFDRPDKSGKRPGYQGWLWWRGQYGAAKRWPVPQGKDPGEAFARGVDLAAWIRAGIPGDVPADVGSLGKSVSGVSASGGGAGCSSAAVVPVSAGRRWPGAGATTPLADVVWPEGFLGGSIAYLRKNYAGKRLDDPRLVVCCPRGQTKWNWVYYRECGRCSGHPHCVVDFLVSPQMLAPLEGAHG